MRHLIWVALVLTLGCDKTTNVPAADAGSPDVPADLGQAAPGPNLDSIAVRGAWEELKGVKLAGLSATHERWVCAVGLGEQLTPNPEFFSSGRARDNHAAELLACGHTIEGTQDSNMVSGARFALKPEPARSAAEALKFDKVNDWRLSPIASAVNAAGPELSYKMVARMVGKRVSVPNSCGDVRPSPDPAGYLLASGIIIKLAQAHDKEHKPRKLGDPRASIDTLHSLRLADRMQLAAAQRHYLSGDIERFKAATQREPSVVDNYRTCMAQMAWELGLNAEAQTWATRVVDQGRSTDHGHANAIRAYIAADEGDWKKALELGLEVFEFRAKSSKNADLVSTALVIPVGLALKANLPAEAKAVADKVIKKDTLAQGPLVVAAIEPKSAKPVSIKELGWVPPARDWAYPATLLIAAHLAAPEEREAALDTLVPGSDLLSYYHARARVAVWYGDSTAEKTWTDRAAGLRAHLKAYPQAASYSR